MSQLTKSGSKGADSPPPGSPMPPPMGVRSAIVMGLSGAVSLPLALLTNHINAAYPRGLLSLAAAVGAIAVLAVLVLGRIQRTYRAAGLTVMLSSAIIMNGAEFSYQLGTLAALSLWILGSAILLVLLTKAPDRVVYRALSWFACIFLLAWPLSGLLTWRPNSPASYSSRQLSFSNQSHADLVVVVLDGFTSPDVFARDLDVDELPFLEVLEDGGFMVEQSAWAPSTKTEFSVGSYLDLRIVVSPDRQLLRGEGPALNAIAGLDYQIHYVESGWYGTVCGALVETCYERDLIDDSVQAALDLGMLGPWLNRSRGHAFGVNSLRAMRDTLSAIDVIESNTTADFLFAHILMPHPPYMVDSSCDKVPAVGLPSGLVSSDPAIAIMEKEAYVEQAKCVGSWLSEFSRVISPDSVAIVMGDHGTVFRRQMDQPIAEWSNEEIQERGTAFLSYRFLPHCTRPTGKSALEAASLAFKCATGLTVEAPPDQIWLESNVGTGLCMDIRTYASKPRC